MTTSHLDLITCTVSPNRTKQFIDYNTWYYGLIDPWFRHHCLIKASKNGHFLAVGRFQITARVTNRSTHLIWKTRVG